MAQRLVAGWMEDEVTSTNSIRNLIPGEDTIDSRLLPDTTGITNSDEACNLIRYNEEDKSIALCPTDLISADDNNGLSQGEDGKLYATQVNNQTIINLEYQIQEGIPTEGRTYIYPYITTLNYINGTGIQAIDEEKVSVDMTDSTAGVLQLVATYDTSIAPLTLSKTAENNVAAFAGKHVTFNLLTYPDTAVMISIALTAE